MDETSNRGLHYNRFRYYDPETAQYISPDPIGLAGGDRPYGYVHNPISWVDPLGLANYDKNDVVYRALTEHDRARLDAGLPIQGKALDGSWSATEHVANRSLSGDLSSGGASSSSPWISTTKLSSIAKSYDNGNGIIVIDLNKVPSMKVEVWQHAPRVNGTQGLPYHRSIWAQEVTIYREIPTNAIIGVIQ